MQLSYSRISTFTKCPYQFKLKYIDKIKTIDEYDACSPLKIGQMLHAAIEKGINCAVQEYYYSYPIISDEHITEAIKVEYVLSKMKDAIPLGGEHEIKIEDEDFIGFIDYLVPVEDGVFDLYDWKYSNNISNYIQSEQLHIYKYYFEKLNPTKRIRNMYYGFYPKSNLKIKYKNKTNKRNETIVEFRKRIMSDMDSKPIQFIQIEYDPHKVIDFLINSKHAIECTEYRKNPTRLCNWCDYQQWCEHGEDWMFERST